jgi:hypothetical protein
VLVEHRDTLLKGAFLTRDSAPVETMNLAGEGHCEKI